MGEFCTVCWVFITDGNRAEVWVWVQVKAKKPYWSEKKVEKVNNTKVKTNFASLFSLSAFAWGRAINLYQRITGFMSGGKRWIYLVPPPVLYTASIPATFSHICINFSSTEPVMNNLRVGTWASWLPIWWHRLTAWISALGFQSESWIITIPTLGRSVPSPQHPTVCMNTMAFLHQKICSWENL